MLEERAQPYSRDVTPSGIEIEFFWEPKRKYEIRRLVWPEDTAEPPTEWSDWREVPSISTITGLMKEPGALNWWAWRKGIDTVLELKERGLLAPSKGPLTRERIEQLAKWHKLRHIDETEKAGDRGQSAHDALELWAQRRVLPDPEFFPPEEAGYVQGLRMFLEAIEPAEPEVIATERMVGSVEHGFAGRYDIEIRTHKPVEIVKRWQPKRGPKYVTLKPSLLVPDLKTSKYVYKDHFAQLEGYELGRIESGYQPSDARAVIHVHPGDPSDPKQPDGPYYEFVRSEKPELYGRAFLAALEFYNAQEEL